MLAIVWLLPACGRRPIDTGNVGSIDLVPHVATTLTVTVPLPVAQKVDVAFVLDDGVGTFARLILSPDGAYAEVLDDLSASVADVAGGWPSCRIRRRSDPMRRFACSSRSPPIARRGRRRSRAYPRDRAATDRNQVWRVFIRRRRARDTISTVTEPGTRRTTFCRSRPPQTTRFTERPAAPMIRRCRALGRSAGWAFAKTRSPLSSTRPKTTCATRTVATIATTQFRADACPGDAGESAAAGALRAIGARFVGVAESPVPTPQLEDLATAVEDPVDLDGDGIAEPPVVQVRTSKDTFRNDFVADLDAALLAVVGSLSWPTVDLTVDDPTGSVVGWSPRTLSDVHRVDTPEIPVTLEFAAALPADEPREIVVIASADGVEIGRQTIAVP